MSKKLVLTYQLSQKELERVKAKFDLESFSVKELGDVDESCLCDAYTAFIALKGNEEQKNLQGILNLFSNTSVFLILRENSFEHLHFAFQNRVDDVFMEELSEHHVNICLIKTSLSRNEITEDIPKEEILELFSSPMNIQSNQQLLFVVRNYLSRFVVADDIAIVEFSEKGTSVLGEISDKLDVESLIKEELPRRFVGKKIELSSKEQYTLAMPIFEQNDYYHWLIVSFDKKQEDFLFNDLFYRFLENILIYKKTKDNERSLEILAGTDDVTGLLNQRRLSEDLQSAVEEHEKKHDTFSIMFIDVDHFKVVNDKYGHLVGSQILTDLGKLLIKILRRSDHIYRYGGDEFVVIMPTIKVGKVHEVAMRVLKEIKLFDFLVRDSETYKMSVSIGLAEYPTDAKSAAQIIEFADEMMYKSKESGRGKVFHVNEVDDANTSS